MFYFFFLQYNNKFEIFNGERDETRTNGDNDRYSQSDSKIEAHSLLREPY